MKDLHGSWESFTGFCAPLYNRSGESPDQSLLNVNWAVQNFINKGAPKEKIILGLAAYGRTFTLANAAMNKPGDPATGAANAGSVILIE